MWTRSILEAATRLVARRPEAAELAGRHIGRMTMRASTQLRRLLSTHGRRDVVEEADKRAFTGRERRFVGEFRDRPDAEQALLGLLRDSAAPSELQPGEARRYDELVAFFWTLGVPEAVWETAATAIHERPETVRRLAAVVAQLAGFNLAAVAAEAGAMLDEAVALDDDRDDIFGVTGMLFDDGRPRKLRAPAGRRDGVLRDELAELAGAGGWPAERAVEILEELEAAS